MDRDYEEREWSPALRYAIQRVQMQASQQINELVEEQAEYLDLPDEVRVDMESGVWKVPDTGDE